MTTSVTDRTVGQIAAEFPASVRVFEKHGIDFCCGGKLPVTEACARKGLDPAALAAEIERSLEAPYADATNWLGAPLSDLVDHILDTHHAYMKAQLPVVEARLAKEEMVLFPLVRALEGGAPAGSFHCGSVRNPIRVMCMEHDSAGDALVQMRQLTDNYTAPDGACNTFRALYFELAEMERDLHRHIHLENNILFPRAMALE